MLPCRSQLIAHVRQFDEAGRGPRLDGEGRSSTWLGSTCTPKWIRCCHSAVLPACQYTLNVPFGQATVRNVSHSAYLVILTRRVIQNVDSDLQCKLVIPKRIADRGPQSADTWKRHKSSKTRSGDAVHSDGNKHSVARSAFLTSGHAALLSPAPMTSDTHRAQRLDLAMKRIHLVLILLLQRLICGATTSAWSVEIGKRRVPCHDEEVGLRVVSVICAVRSSTRYAFLCPRAREGAAV